MHRRVRQDRGQLRLRGVDGVRHVRGPRRREFRRRAGPGAQRDRRRVAGAARGRRVAADLPGGAPLVRLERGRIINLDIGGGSLELSSGVDEEPEVALSLPLGAGG